MQPRRPIQPFSTISLYDAPIFGSNSNAVQVGLHKQYSRGLILNAEYEFIRALGTENFQNSLTVNDSYGNISTIRPHQLIFSYSYDLPVGRGKAFLGTAGQFADTLIGGWSLSGITTFQSGSPFSVTSASSLTGGVSGRADRIPGVPLYPSKKSITQWFNPAAFAATSFTYGNSAYNLLHGPGYQNWDTAITKTTSLHDRATLQIRVDAFNVFNHPTFANPAAAITNPAAVGTISSTNGANRTLQLGGKLVF